jgi:hypothetical protein
MAYRYDLREHSRKQLTVDLEDGVLMSEAMAKDRVQMERDLTWYRDAYRESQQTIEHQRHSIAGHKAAYTKLKQKIAERQTTIDISPDTGANTVNRRKNRCQKSSL